ILAAMQGGKGLARHARKNREMEVIDMEVEDVEFGGPLPNPVEHQHVIGNDVLDGGVQPQRLRGAASQLGGRHGITAGKQRDLMAQPNEFFREIAYDALSTSVHSRRDTFG